MRSLPLVIALRYLFAKKSQNIINIISMISALGVMVGTAALLIVLSVFNGLNSYISSLFGGFDPDLRIEAVEGKAFDPDSAMIERIMAVEGVEAASFYLVDNALIKADRRQMPAMIMGVDRNYSRATNIDSITTEGTPINGTLHGCSLGYILAQQLGVHPASFSNQITVFAPKRKGQINTAMPDRSFVQKMMNVTGVFTVLQAEYDANYLITDIGTARELFCYTGDEASAVAVRCAHGADCNTVATALQHAVGSEFRILDKWQQHASFFKMMKVEKFMAYLILAFIIVIAAFNIIGSLSMLIFEKKESIFVLKSMGATRSLVTRVFLFEGWLVSVGGVLIGLVLGVLLVLLQQHFGLITFGSEETYILNSYPVELQLSDLVVVFATVVVVGIVAAVYPVYSIVGKYYKNA